MSPKGHCISYFSVTLIKYPQKSNLRQKGFVWGSWFQRDSVHHLAGKATVRESTTAGRKLANHIFIFAHKAERERKKPE